MHEAAKAGHEDCCRVLLTHGASRAVLNSSQNTPADAALLNDLFRVAEVTKSAPGEVQALQKLRQVRGHIHWPGMQLHAQNYGEVCRGKW